MQAAFGKEAARDEEAVEQDAEPSVPYLTTYDIHVRLAQDVRKQ